MLWSILIAGIPERYHLAQPLLYSLLEKQEVARMFNVECLYLMDNCRRPVGSKRNALLDMAQGEYISFVDDDDEVAGDYVGRIRRALLQAKKTAAPDVLCFRQDAHLQPHGIVHECHYSLEYFKREPRRMLEPIPGEDGKPKANVLKWTGPPAHTMVWRRALVDGIRFPEENFGEDVAWVDQACQRAASEVVLDGSPLYHYKFGEAGTTTRG